MILYNGSSYEVKLDVVTEGNIGVSGEVDYYKLDVDPGNVVSISLTHSIDDQVVVSLVDANGSIIDTNTAEITRDTWFIGPHDVITVQTDLYVKVNTLNGVGAGSYSLSHEIYESQSAVTDKIFELTNNERVKAGRSQLIRNTALDNAAFLHSDDMRVNDYYSHTGLNGSSIMNRVNALGYTSNIVGENIDQTNSAFNTVERWMNSSGHRENILRSAFGEFGTGYSADESSAYWTQVFGGIS